MKQIILVRHAKAADTFVELTDFERPLSKRGKMDAKEMAKRLAEKGFGVDLVVASSARRAKKTARRMAPAFGISKKEILLKKQLYLAGTGELRKALGEALKNCDRVMLVAHNPGISDLLFELCTEGGSFPTCGVGVVEIKRDAATRLKPGCGRLVFYDSPGKRGL